MANIENSFLRAALDIQILLSISAIVFALLLSQLLQRMTQRKMRPGSKYAWIATSLLPFLLSPFLVILFLVGAKWFSATVLPGEEHTIIAITKIAMVWFAARTLLLLTHQHFMAYFISGVMLLLALLSVTNLLTPTLASLNDITFEASTFRLSLLAAIRGIFTLIVLFWGAGVLSQSGETWLRHSRLSFNARELAVKFLRIALYLIAFLLTLNQMGVDLTAFTVFGGALAVGVGFGLQKISSNFISGITLLFEKSITVGDLIEVGGVKGWVRQMAIRHTLIETSDGREMLIPNEDLIIGKVTNWTYTNTRARGDILVAVPFDTDPDLVRKLLIQAAKDYPRCISDPSPACNLNEFLEYGMQFKLMFWISDIKEGMNDAKSEVMILIVRAFRDKGIKFAVA